MRLPISDSYSIEIDERTFTLAIYRGDTLILATAPHGELSTPLAIEDRRITAHIGHAVVTLDLGDEWVSVRWAAPHTVSSAFLLTSNWYGQGEIINQQWPLNRIMLRETPFTTTDNGETGLSPIVSPLWLSDQGVALRVLTPISVSLNAPPDSYPRFAWSLGTEQGPFDQRPFPDPGGIGDGLLCLTGHNLHFDILLADNVVEAHRKLVSEIGHLTQTPPLEEIAKPIWNTWARYHADINQEVVLRYAREIIEHDYPRGRFVIDDRWQGQYGDLVFDSQRFPDPRAMIDTLHGMGFTVHTWVVPFFDPTSRSFQDAARQGYLIHQPDASPYIMQWWQGLGGLLDMTNPAALEWFKSNLHQLQADTGLDGFKFDAGEATYTPADAVLHEPVSGSEFTQRYINFVGEHFAWSDVRSGWLNHRCPVLPRQWDKASTWGLDNGLHSVITGALSMSLIGYALFLPDMIGGNAYHEQPDAELMIRWAQVNALMPGLQFSLAPWDYGDECDRLCHQAAILHEDFAPILHQYAAIHAQTGEPIIRPLWWIAPDDIIAQHCDDQFLLGEDYLVAPVIKAGQDTRDVYLPSGLWKDYRDDKVHRGPLLLHDYPVPLNMLPIFERIVGQDTLAKS